MFKIIEEVHIASYIFFLFNKFIEHFTMCIKTYLSLPVDANYSRSAFMRSGNKDGVTTYSVHVDACSSLNVVQMNVTVFGDQIDHIIFRSNLTEGKTRKSCQIQKDLYFFPFFSSYLVH